MSRNRKVPWAKDSMLKSPDDPCSGPLIKIMILCIPCIKVKLGRAKRIKWEEQGKSNRKVKADQMSRYIPLHTWVHTVAEPFGECLKVRTLISCHLIASPYSIKPPPTSFTRQSLPELPS
jgi:hypothetical protein